MNAAVFRPFAESLHNLIRDAFDKSDLEKMLLFKLGERLDGISSEDDFDAVVFRVVTWADKNGQMLELAEAATATKTKRRDLSELAGKMKALVDDVGTTPQQRPRAEEQPRSPIEVERTSLGWDELTALARGYERLIRVLPDEAKRRELCHDLVHQMRGLLDRPNDIADSLHLSPAVGDRLAAIVALQARPDIRYLQWLAERLIVEDAFVGYFATVALLMQQARFQTRISTQSPKQPRKLSDVALHLRNPAEENAY